jgi:two-component system sensor histidine kinase/response regulator
MLVLVVEDDNISAKMLRFSLMSRGHDVELAINGQIAVDMSAITNYDLILMDIQMPVLDGWSATRAIRDREITTGKHVSIVAVTSLTATEDMNMCYAMGMDDYLAKPVHKENLIETLEKYKK